MKQDTKDAFKTGIVCGILAGLIILLAMVLCDPLK